MNKYRQVFISDYGTHELPDAVLVAYGVDKPPMSTDKRRKEVKEYIRSVELMERNLKAIISHQWIMGRDGVKFCEVCT